MKKLNLNFKNSRFGYLFSFTEPQAKGRLCMVSHNCLVAMINSLVTGVFYTSFLMIYGIDTVNIGIIIFIPYIAACFNIFSPMILERFKKRKLILALCHGGYHTLNILGITLMPALVQDPAARITWFVIIVFAANIINAIGGSGYTVWHVHYIPPNVRADYFAINQIIVSFTSLVLALGSSVIADALVGSPHQDTIIILFRYLAFALAILDLIVLCTPKEPEYARSAEKPRLQDVFIKPVKNKKFLLTMLIVFLHTFFANIPAGQINYFLLNDIRVSYTLIGIINVIYPVFLFVFRPLWKKILYRLGWFKTYGLGLLLGVVPAMMYSFVTPVNYLWLFTTVRMLQHFNGVGVSLTSPNMPFIHLPEEDQTNYISFHVLITNVAVFLGMMSGTWFVSAFGGSTLDLFGFSFSSVPILLWIQAMGELLVPIIILLLYKQLKPKDEGI